MLLWRQTHKLFNLLWIGDQIISYVRSKKKTRVLHFQYYFQKWLISIYINFHTIITVVAFVTISNAILDHGLNGLNANGAWSSNAELRNHDSWCIAIL